MKPGTAPRLAWGAAAFALALYGAAMALAVLNVEQDGDILFPAAGLFVVTGYATVGALIASRRGDNPIGWLFLVIAGGFSITGFAEDYAARAAAIPASLPGAEWAAWLGSWSGLIFMAPVPLVLLLFPSGRLPSSRWRPVLWAAVAGPVVVVVGIAIRPWLDSGPAGPLPSPTGIEGADGLGRALMVVGSVTAVAVALASVAGLIVRFRRSRGEERQQIRLVAYVGAAAALFLLATFPSPSPVDDWTFLAFFGSIGFGIPIASAVAILRYRLYALDLVLKRAMVFGILAAFITLAYFVIVIGIPTLVFGAGGRAENLVPFIAAAVIAIAFQPVRRAAARFADRLVYGRRKSPYEVMAEFSAEVARAPSPNEALVAMADIVRTGVGAARAEVWLRVGRELRRAATVPHDEARSAVVATDYPPVIPDVDLAAPVRDEGELIGALAVSMPRSAPLTPSQEQLVRDLAAQATLVLRNVRLIEELRASRKRLVGAQDEERRRIERNIHDGAQQQLVALAVNVRLARSLSEKDPARAAEVLERLQDDAQQALEDLRDLARGIYPPLLVDKGLAAALEAQARKSPLPVEVRPDGVGRYPAEAEAAVYFCVLEALQNAAKYSRASSVEVRLHAADGELRFEVTDDGTGFDPGTTPRGSGLQNMADRLEALGGSLRITSAVARGTTVAGAVPIRNEAVPR